MVRLQFKLSSAIIVSLLLVPVKFMIEFNETHQQSNMELILVQLNISRTTLTWMTSTDTCVCCISSVLAGGMSNQFGICRVYITGVVIMTVFQLCFLIPGADTTFWLALLLTALSSVGKGIIAALTTPAAYILVKQEQIQRYIVISSTVAPVGSVAAAFMAGYVGVSIGWQYMNVFVGCLGIIDVVLLLTFLPKGEIRDLEVKFDYIGLTIISIALVALIMSVSCLTNDTAWIIAIIVLALSVTCFVIFWVYNQSYSQTPIFATDFFNTTYKKIFLAQILLGAGSVMDNQVCNNTMSALLNIDMMYISMVMASIPCTSLITGPIIEFLSSKFIQSYASIILQVICSLVMISHAMVILSGGSLALVIIDLAGGTFAQLGTSILMDQLMYSTVRPEYSTQLGVAGQLAGCIQSVLGSTLGAAILENIRGELRSVLSLCELFCAALTLGSITVQSLVGNFSFEEGRIGWKANRLRKVYCSPNTNVESIDQGVT